MINVNIDDSESCSGKGNGNCDYNGNDMKGRNIMILVQCYVVWQGLIFEKELDLLDSAAHRYDNMLNLNIDMITCLTSTWKIRIYSLFLSRLDAAH